MIFTPPRPNLNLMGGSIYGVQYLGNHHITTVTKSLRYLGVHITPSLKWDTHMNLMVNCARLTIRGISILRNSIQGLNFMN